MDGRTDINKYHNGCSVLINATVLPHGGVVKRPGTQYIATAPNKANLFPFEFSVDDALVLEYSNLLIRFYKDGAAVLDNAGTETIPTGNIVAHWLLNETEGTNVADDDGGTHDGTSTVNIETIVSDGKVNSGFNLDGQYTIEIADSANFSFTDNSDDTTFSINLWGKVTEKGGLQVLVSKWRNEATTKEWRFSISNDRKLQLHLADTSADLSGDIVAHWKLNDDAANTAVDDAVASVPHDGVASSNTDTFNATGQVNGALDFGGVESASVTDHAQLSYDDSGSNPFSIAAWAFVTATAGQQYILSKYDQTTGSEAREWRLLLDDVEKIRFTLFDESANASAEIRTDDVLSGGWHLIVATYDSTGGETAMDSGGAVIYIDNVVVDTTITYAGTYTAMENLGGLVYIGANENASGNADNQFADKLDNIMLFNKELSVADVAALWNSGNGTESLAGAVIEISAVSDDALVEGWHLLTCTYSAPSDETTAANGIILYVDGAVVDSTKTNNANYTAMQNGAEEIRIGSQRNSGDSANENFWEDEIDEVSVHSDVLTPTEIAAMYTTAPYSIVSPYTSAQAFELHVTQSADVMYIAHEDIHPKKLSRFGAVDWTIINVPFTGGPFLEENTDLDALVGFARTGGTARAEYYFPTGTVGTLTATDADSGNDNQPFNSNMVGALWLVKHTRDNDNSTTTFAKDTNVVPTLETFASGAIFIKGDYTITVEPVATSKEARLWRKEENGKWQQHKTFRAASSFSATEDNDNVLYAMTRSDSSIKGTLIAKNQENNGVVRVTGFTSSTVVTCTVVDKVLSDNSTDNAVTTSMWAEGAWSDFRGYPRTVTFFEDRLWWASSTNNPDTLWASNTGDYENMGFTNLALDDEALEFPLNDNEVSQIQWMSARQVMAVGAANKEYRFGASDIDKPVTPSDRKATPQTSFGSGNLQPLVLNDALFFFQRQGRKLRAMKFDSITENFTADDATLLVYTMFESVPTDLAVQRVPDSIIWSVRTDGVMPTFTYEPDEEVSGWARQITDNSADPDTPVGFFESVTVIHGSTEDEVWVSVRRVVNSSTVRYIERFKPRNWGDDIEDAFFVDAGITYDSTAASTMTGGTHLIGETVAVFADGVVFDNAVVDGSGEIVLKLDGVITTASTVQWGIPYTMKVRTMRLSVPQDGNTIQTRIKRIHSVVVRFIRSLLGSAGQEYGGIEYLQDLQATFSDEAQDTEASKRLAKGGLSEDAYVTIVSSDPVPFTILSTVTSFEIEEIR